MVHLKERWGVNHVLFVDDLFVASRKRTENSAIDRQESPEDDLDVQRPRRLRPSRSPEDHEKSRLLGDRIGLESGSNELFQKMEKQAGVERGEQAVNWTHQAGIRTKGLFMLGYPGENAQTIQLTKEYVARLPMHVMNLTKFTPYPGSPIYQELYGTKIREDHWERMNGMNFVWAPMGSASSSSIANTSRCSAPSITAAKFSTSTSA